MKNQNSTCARCSAPIAGASSAIYGRTRQGAYCDACIASVARYSSEMDAKIKTYSCPTHGRYAESYTAGPSCWMCHERPDRMVKGLVTRDG